MNSSIDDRILTSAARAAIGADDLTRLRLIRQKPFIAYGAVQQIYGRLEEALDDYPTGGDSHLLLIGDSGMGKSLVVKRFAAANGCREDGALTVATVPVLYISFAISASAKGFLGRILERLNAPYGSSASAEVLYPLVLRLLRRIGLKVLIIDEVHHVLNGHRDRRIEALNVLKLLANDLGITIVACGIDSVLRAVDLDPQLARRFDPIVMQRWTVGDESAGFINSLEAHLPLRMPSNLSEEATLIWLLAESEGITGEITNIVRKAAKEAIQSGRERIDLQLLKSLGWTRLSQRKRRAELALKAGQPT